MQRLLQNQQGSVLSVEFLIVSILILFLVYGATDYWLMQVKMQQAEHIKNYYLDRIRVEGCLTDADRQDMINRFQEAGFTVTNIDAPATRVLRNIDDPTQSEVWLRVEAKMDGKPFVLAGLLNMNSPNEFTFRVAGRGLSERVTP